MAVQIVSIESVGSLVAAILLRISCVPSRALYLARTEARASKKRKFPARLFAIPLKPMKARPLILP